MLEQITPVILTLNEAPNLGRLLAKLSWAKDIVVVDSLSGDGTPAVAQADPRVRFFQRPFDDHATQWRFALERTAIATAWVLRLDADYVPTDALLAELRDLKPPDDLAAYRIAFRYCIGGKALRASLYPASTVLFRLGKAQPWQDGHTERWRVDGKITPLRERLLHDDRKPVEAWLQAQLRYHRRERDKLLGPGPKDRVDRLRLRHWFAPALVFLHLLFVRGLIFDGRAGLTYAYQRTLAEITLALYLLEARLGKET